MTNRSRRRRRKRSQNSNQSNDEIEAKKSLNSSFEDHENDNLCPTPLTQTSPENEKSDTLNGHQTTIVEHYLHHTIHEEEHQHLCKRKHGRRAKKRRSNSKINNDKEEVEISMSGDHPLDGKGRRNSIQSSNSPSFGVKQICLRPTHVPQLNAPRNSTQFIMNEHDEHDVTTVGTTSIDENTIQNVASTNESSHLHNNNVGQYLDGFTEEDEKWAERDFLSVYETAYHVHDIGSWTHHQLTEKILGLEQRQQQLSHLLSRKDCMSCDDYIHKLRTDVSTLTERSVELRRTLEVIGENVDTLHCERRNSSLNNSETRFTFDGREEEDALTTPDTTFCNGQQLDCTNASGEVIDRSLTTTIESTGDNQRSNHFIDEND